MELQELNNFNKLQNKIKQFILLFTFILNAWKSFEACLLGLFILILLMFFESSWVGNLINKRISVAFSPQPLITLDYFKVPCKPVAIEDIRVTAIEKEIFEYWY